MFDRIKSAGVASLSGIDEFKEEDYEGYKEYRARIDLTQMIQVTCSYNPIQIAIDDLYEKCYNNTAMLEAENAKLREAINQVMDKCYYTDEKLIIVEAKIGSLNPADYQFPDIYKQLHELLQKLSEMEKELRDLQNSDDDVDTVNYMKGVMNEKFKKFANKLSDIELNINAFVSLYEFRHSQDYRPSSMSSSSSQTGAKRAELTSIDPKLGKLPETHEEEKKCLYAKVKEIKQHLYSIESQLRPEHKEDSGIDYGKRIDEVLDLAKNNKRRIEECQNTCDQNINNTKTTLNKNIRDEIDKVKDLIAKKIKDLPQQKNVSVADNKGDIKDLLSKHNTLQGRVQQLEKGFGEHDEDLNRIIRAVDSKANKDDLHRLDSKLKDLDTTVEQLREYLQNLKIPKQVDSGADLAKIDELNRILVALEGRIDRAQDALNERMNEINKFMEMIKEDVDKSLEEQERQTLKTLSKCNVCEARIDSIEKQLKNYSPSNAGISLPDVEGKEALKGLRELEKKVQKLKDDLLKRCSVIEYNYLPSKVDKEEFEESNKLFTEKIVALEREIKQLQLQIQALKKQQETAVKEIKKQRLMETSNERDEASLIKKPLLGYKCANCERDLNNLEGMQAEFYNWKKMPRSIRNKKNQKVNMNLHNIGQGFSKMLQTFSTDSLASKDLLKTSRDEFHIDEDVQESDLSHHPPREFLSDNEDERVKTHRDNMAKRLLPSIGRK